MRRFAGRLARFVILEGPGLGVTRRGVALCLEVPRLGSSQRSVVSFQCGEAGNGNGRPVNHSGCEKRKFRERTAIGMVPYLSGSVAVPCSSRVPMRGTG